MPTPTPTATPIATPITPRPSTGPGGAAVDVVIVGARPAGAATALQLARAGHRVMVLDRTARGSDTLSTHALMRGGVHLLHRWGLLDQVVAAGTPAIPRVTFEYAGQHTPVDLAQPLYAPRRTVLDPIIADAAATAGARIHHGVEVQGLVTDDFGTVCGVRGRRADGSPFEQLARIVVGADGVTSRTARAVAAPATHRGRHAGAGMYTYVRGITTAADGVEWLFTPGANAGLVPTNHGEVCVFVSTDRSRFMADFRGDREAAFARLLAEASPQASERVQGATRVAPIRGFAARPGWLRRAHGPGWALVGDAGAMTDPISAHGITAALRDADLLSRALDAGLTGRRPLEMALADYERERNRLSLPLMEAADAIVADRRTIHGIKRHHLALSAAMKAEVAHLDDLHEPRVGVAA